MARMHGLGEFDERLTLEAPFGVKYVIYRRGDTFDEDGGRNSHPWLWTVAVGDMAVDDHTAHRCSEYVDNWGFRHSGFPTREDAYGHMSRNCKTPKEYDEIRKAREKQAGEFWESWQNGTFTTGMGHGEDGTE